MGESMSHKEYALLMEINKSFMLFSLILWFGNAESDVILKIDTIKEEKQTLLQILRLGGRRLGI